MDLDRELHSFANDGKSLRHSREDIFGGARVHLVATRQVFQGKAVNLSVGGIGVVLGKEAAQNLRNGHKVDLEIVWSDGGSLTASARVAWADHERNDGCLYGLVFEALDEETRDSIHRHLIRSVVSRHLDG